MKNDLARDKAVEKLVAAKLRAQLQAPGPDCPGAEILAAYVERMLTPGERKTCETHLVRCTRCQEQVAELVRLSEAEGPAGVLEAAAAARISRPKATRFVWAWAASAAVALVVAGLWYTGEFRPLLRQPGETALSPTPPAGSRALAPEQQKPKLAAVPSGQPGAKEARHQKEIAGLVSRGGPTATRTPPLETRSEPEGVAGAGAPTNQLAGAAPGAIVTPRERARLAAGPTANRAVESYAASQEARLPDVTEGPPPPAAPAPQTENEDAAAKKSAGREKAEVTSLADVAASRTTAPPAGGLAKVSRAGNWRVGPHGLIQKADSSGNWVTLTSGVRVNLFDITFPRPSAGWAIGQSGTILRTTDGGITWERTASPTAEDLVRVTATDEFAARVVTRSGREFMTTDGGRSWSASPQP